MGSEVGKDGLLVAAFYAFTPLAETDQQELLTALPPLAQAETVLGSVLIAAEGVNGTVCGPSVGSGTIARSFTQPTCTG